MFGFDDFALLFAEAAPELLATEGTTAAELAAQEAAREAALAAAQQAAAQEAAQSGILQASQMNPELLNSINGPGVKTAGLGDDFLGFLERNNIGVKGVELNPAGAEYPGAPYGYEPGNAFFDKGPVRLEPVESPYTPEDFGYQGINKYTGRPIVESTSLNPFPGGTENIMSKTMAHAPLDANALDYSSQIGYEQANSPALQDYQKTQLDDELLARRTAAPPSNVPQFENPASTTQNVFRGNPAEAGYQPPQVTRGGYFNNGITGEYTDTLSPFERGMDTAGRYFDKAADYVEKNPYKSAALAYYGAYKTGMLDQPKQEPIADSYKNPYSMAGFRRSSPTPSAYRYTPRYAEGGITSYARGGRSKTEAAMDFYDAMNPEPAAAPALGSVGIYYDVDPDTRYLDPMEAAMVRMSKLNSRTNVQAPTMTPNRRMGELDFKPVAAARGGIMHFAEGGYSAPSSGTFAPGTEAVKDYAFNALARSSQPSSLNLTAPGPINFNPNAPSTPVETPITNAQSAGGGGGGGRSAQEPPSAWSQMSPEERAAYYAEHPIEGGLALGAQDALGWTALGALSKAVGPDAWYDSRLEKQGLNPESFKEGPPDPNFSSQAAAAARQEGQIAAVNAANTAGAGLVANPMAVERAPVTTTPAPVTESTPAPAPVGITSIPSQFPSSPTVTPAPAPAPVPMMTVKETWTGEDAPDPGQGWTQERFGARDGTRWTRLKEVPAQTTDDGEGGFRTSPVGGWGSYGNAVGNATGRDATAGNGYGPGYGAVDPGYRGGSEAAQGGLSTPYGFQHMARGGITSIHAPYNLGGYAAGGNPRLLRGPGDGMSDNIPATINNRQPARLADGEFVVPADVVSHLGNGSTEAGAKQLHDMMTRIRKGRTGNPKQGKQINPQKYLPA